MNTVYKYPLSPHTGPQRITFKGADPEIVLVDFDGDGQLCLWVAHDVSPVADPPDERPAPGYPFRTFWVVQTGQGIGTPHYKLKHVGSAIQRNPRGYGFAYVVHVFEEV